MSLSSSCFSSCPALWPFIHISSWGFFKHSEVIKCWTKKWKWVLCYLSGCCRLYLVCSLCSDLHIASMEGRRQTSAFCFQIKMQRCTVNLIHNLFEYWLYWLCSKASPMTESWVSVTLELSILVYQHQSCILLMQLVWTSLCRFMFQLAPQP